MKEIIKKIKKYTNNQKILSILFAVSTFFALCSQDIIPTYNPISWILFLMLIILFNKIDLYNKNFFKASVIFSIIFVLLLTFGKTVYENIYSTQINILKEFISLRNIISIVCFLPTIYAILINVIPKIYNYEIKSNKVNITPKKIFIISFIIILLGWLPYFLALYPGVLSSDSISEINIIMNNLANVDNHHPIIHVIYVYIPFKIGMTVFNNTNIAVACSSLVQMISLATIFSYFTYFLAKRKINNSIIFLCIIFFAFIPMHGYYSVTMWKDVMFAGLVLLLILKLIEICDKKDNLKFKDLISFIIISLLTIFFRNNAIYMFFILIIFMLIILRNKYKILLIAFSIILIIYYLITGPTFNYLNIAKSSSTEYIGIPLQQIGRMAYKNIEFTDEEEAIINKLINVEKMKENYTPNSTDGIKFNENYNAGVFDENKKEYFNLWLRLVIKHPSVAIESYAVSTLGYWYPGINYWTVNKDVAKNTHNIYKNSLAPKLVEKYVNSIESRRIPILNMTWSTSLAFWIITIFCYICVRKKKTAYIIPYIPIYGIWLTMMIASPVFGEFRYIYSSYTCLPILIILPFLSEISNQKEGEVKNEKRNKK